MKFKIGAVVTALIILATLGALICAIKPIGMGIAIGIVAIAMLIHFFMCRK